MIAGKEMRRLRRFFGREEDEEDDEFEVFDLSDEEIPVTRDMVNNLNHNFFSLSSPNILCSLNMKM